MTQTPDKHQLTRPRAIGPQALILALGIAHILLLVACASDANSTSYGDDSDPRSQPSSDMAREGRAVFAPPAADDDDTQRTVSSSAASPDWTIALWVYRGENRQELAELAVQRVREEGKLRGARVESRGDATIVAYGAYAGPEDRKARADLERIRNIRVDGALPFSEAVLAPPLNAITGSRPEYDLRTVKQRYGPDAAYTLQVAIYTTLDRSTPSQKELQQFHAAAEEAVNRFRSEGEQAFYYHTPRSSMVTIGVLGPDDFHDDGNRFTQPVQSPRLLQLRERHPYNLFNGRAIRDVGPDGKQRLQPSFLVAIPDR